MSIVPEEAKARYRNGVLEIVAPKYEEEGSSEIEIEDEVLATNEFNYDPVSRWISLLLNLNSLYTSTNVEEPALSSALAFPKVSISKVPL
jgi:hypothetical protein